MYAVADAATELALKRQLHVYSTPRQMTCFHLL